MGDVSYRTIVIDPPWPEKGGGKCKRGADRHYPVLSVEDIPRVVWSAEAYRPCEDTHLYLWVTNNYLPQGLWVITVLGFRYVTAITWAKDRAGLGQYFRGQTEHMLFAVKGNGISLRREHTERRDLSTLILAKRGKHSAKPEAAYLHIEAASPGPYLEMFARTRRDGWDAWGNEV